MVLTRKSSLFGGNARGGRTAAILAILTSIYRRHDVASQRYLTQLLTSLSPVRRSQLPGWLADRWKQIQPARPTGLESSATLPS